MIDTIIVNARAVCPDGTKQGCIAIDGGKIQFVGPQFMMPQARTVIDAEERFVIPGLVDPHVHYGLYGDDDFVKNCKRDWEPDALGALFGGVTTVMPMLMSPGSYVPVVRDLIEWGNKRSAVDFALTPIVHQEHHLKEIVQGVRLLRLKNAAGMAVIRTVWPSPARVLMPDSRSTRDGNMMTGVTAGARRCRARVLVALACALAAGIAAADGPRPVRRVGDRASRWLRHDGIPGAGDPCHR